MKTRFNTFDIICCVTELQTLVGMRVNNVYDIDNKTYLIRFQRGEEKAVLLLESGNRIHTTAFEWPKNVAPSGFSMKMRKHLKNKRLEHIVQVGTDRIMDLQFGSGEAAYHIIMELYDRGNIVLTDCEMVILNVLRPHTEGDKVKFAVREKYPQNRARETNILTKEKLLALIDKAKPGDQLKKILLSNSEYGPPLIEHVLVKRGFTNATKIGKTFNLDYIDTVLEALLEAESIFNTAKQSPLKGYIIQKKEEKPSTKEGEEKEYLYSNQEFHPMLFEQHKSLPYKEFDTFNQAVDEFLSTLESQKLELKALQQEREALKKLQNVRKDHDQRLIALEKAQEVDKQKAELITRNQTIVDQAILAVQTAIANQHSWDSIEEYIKEAQKKGDPLAKRITKLKLQTNQISLYLTDPYASEDNTDSERENEENKASDSIPPMNIDVDLDLTAFANARRYYDQKRNAAKKQQKTIESQSKALKSAERKTKQTLKDVQTITNINKARKVYWFEKFFWFISSENYLVIAGRDQQQNELIVKRYLRPTDVYVHADIHGASSVVIKNPSGQPVPPKTLNEAGTMAICYSIAWEAKVVTNAYWVWGEQVTKTAPTGEYLTTGSFMIRGKKNFLPPSYLILGLSFLFKVEDACVEKHRGERKILTADNEDTVTETSDSKDEVELEILDESDEEELKEVEQGIQDVNLESTADEVNSNGDQIRLQTEVNTKEVEEVLSEVKEDDNEEATDSESENESKYPDTQIKIQHFQGTKVEIIKDSGLKLEEHNKDAENVVYLGDDKPVVIKPTQRSRGNSESKTKVQKEQQKISKESNPNKQQLVKRGQKSKLKKIKEKYADQDEEERKLRMEILKSSGSPKQPKKNKKGKDTFTKTNKKNEPKAPRVQASRNQEGDDGGGEDDEPLVQADVDMIDTLTGIPFGDDELLFSVPVVAPYNTLANYKFKVKLTPGTGRRGKAAKTAVAMFLKDRTITPREKDLLKAVKDEQLARNLPGKVKLSAPRLQTLKK